MTIGTVPRPAEQDIPRIGTAYNEPQPEPHAEGPDIRALLLPFWRGKWLILFTTLLAALVAVPLAMNSEERYTASGRVLYDPERLQIIDLNSIVASDARSALSNQIEFLRSAMVLERVIETLRLEERPEFNPVLEAEAQTRTPLDRLVERLPLPDRAVAALESFGLVSLPAPAFASPLERADYVRTAALATLTQNLQLRPLGNTRVIEITYSSGDPVLAAAVVNSVGDQYIRTHMERKREDILAAADLLTTRVRDLENRLNVSEEALRTAQLELAAGAEHGSSVVARQVEAVTGMLNEASRTRASYEARYAAATGNLRAGADLQLVPDFRASATISGLRARERELLDQEAGLRAIVTNASNPTLLRLQALLAEVRRNMAEEAELVVSQLASDIAIAQQQEQALRAELADLEARAAEQSRAEMRLERLEREVQANRSVYESFLNRTKEATEQASLLSPDAQFLSRARTPQIPDTASRKRNVLTAGLGGLGLGIGLILLMERLNNTFRRDSDVEARTGLSVLAELPKVGRRSKPKDLVALLLSSPRNTLSEPIRGLRTSILFSNLDQSPKVIMFTSSLPMEGKTTTAMLTAITSQQMDRSAVLVDCDLRRRAMGGIFPIAPTQPGLFAALQGACPIEEAVYVEPKTGLNVLTAEAGVLGRNNPADILSSRSFNRLIGQLKARYDLVVLDTPPTLLFSDSRIIAQHADSVVYLVRWNHTRRGAVLDGLRKLAPVRGKIAGIGLTLVNEKDAARYGSANYAFYRRAYFRDRTA